MIINMTPHPVHIVDSDNNIVCTFPKGDTQIRLEAKTVPLGILTDDKFAVPLTYTEFGEAVGLPEYQPGTFYIVSQIVKSALPNRSDLFVPAEVVRDAAGNIIGCKSLGI